MAIDVTETDQVFEVLADIPGHAKEEIQISVNTDESTLTISTTDAVAAATNTAKSSASPNSHRDTSRTDLDNGAAAADHVPPSSRATAAGSRRPFKSQQQNHNSDRHIDDMHDHHDHHEESAPQTPWRHSLLAERAKPFNTRCLTFPLSANLSGTTAHFSHGTVMLTVPKRNLPSPIKTISIEV